MNEWVNSLSVGAHVYFSHANGLHKLSGRAFVSFCGFSIICRLKDGDVSEGVGFPWARGGGKRTTLKLTYFNTVEIALY